MNTNLEYYKFFYYVGKLHSITLAAEELNVSQPAVSQAIRNLEREIGSTRLNSSHTLASRMPSSA